MTESSPGPDVDPKVEDAESSPAAQGEKGSMLDAVKAALEPKEDKSPESEEPDPQPESEDAESAKEGAGAEDEGDLTDEEISRLKPKTKKRIDNLLAERADRDRTIDTLRPKAEQFDQMVRFVRDAGLAPPEVNELLDIGKNLKRDPRKAYDQLRPIYDRLQQMYGDVLPDDLQAQVTQGMITAEYAKALAAARTDANVARQNAERMAEEDGQRRAEETRQAQITETKSRVTEWETSKERADPDWKTKQPHVMRAIENALLRRHAEGKANPTAAEAVEIADKALAEVNKELKALLPKPKAIMPVTDVSSTASTAKPKTMLEAARAGLAAARSG